MPKIIPHISLGYLLALLFGIACLSPASSQGQYLYNTSAYSPDLRFEVGVAAGVINCATDIEGNTQVYKGPFSGVAISNTNGTIGIYGSAIWKNIVGMRLEAHYGMVEGYDSLLIGATHPSAVGRFDRNLNFRSRILEIATTIEFHLFQALRSFDRASLRLSPYVVGGIALFQFNPQGYTSDGWVDLRPLRLEGQGFAEYPDRKEYGRYAISYPFGIGVSYEVSSRLVLRLEAINRITSTDYLDDVHEANWVNPSLFDKYLSPPQAALARQLYNRSTKPNLISPQNTRPRGNPSSNDYYWTMVFKLGFNLNSSGYGWRGAKGAARKLRCPRF